MIIEFNFSTSNFSLWGKFWKEVSNHIQTTSCYWKCQEMLQTTKESLQWTRTRGMQNNLRIIMHNPIRWKTTWYILNIFFKHFNLCKYDFKSFHCRQICWWNWMWKVTCGDMWGWMYYRRRVSCSSSNSMDLCPW